jgi:RND family efflux transporter MFP subunit
MNIMNTRFIPLAGVLFLTANIFLASCSADKPENELQKNDPVTVRLGVATQQINENITMSGRVESQQTAAISTRMMGFISSIKVKPGDKVQEGELLVQINNADIMAKRAQAQALISETDAALKDAQKDFERFEQLYKQQSASAKEFENAKLHFNSIKAKTEAAQQMKNEADAMVAYTNLVAPFTGVITQKNNDEGSMANPGMPILMMEQSGALQVSASVDESEVGKLQKGMEAEVVVKSTGKKFTGKVNEISPSSQFSGGQFQIKVIIPASENADLFSGMFVRVNVAFKNHAEIPSAYVPVAAVVYKDQLTGLYTVGEDQTAQLRWVKTGKINGDLVEILSGLKPREKFITQSESKLYSGVPVSIGNKLDLTILK